MSNHELTYLQANADHKLPGKSLDALKNKSLQKRSEIYDEKATSLKGSWKALHVI